MHSRTTIKRPGTICIYRQRFIIVVWYSILCSAIATKRQIYNNNNIQEITHKLQFNLLGKHRPSKCYYISTISASYFMGHPLRYTCTMYLQIRHMQPPKILLCYAIHALRIRSPQPLSSIMYTYTQCVKGSKQIHRVSYFNLPLDLFRKICLLRQKCLI